MYQISLAQVVYPTNLSKFEAFVTVREKLLFYVEELIDPRSTPPPQTGGPPLAGYPRLLIQYIRIYPPYLEAVSSIRNLRTRHAVVTKGPLNMDRYSIHGS
jgi:hypothetical protein